MNRSGAKIGDRVTMEDTCLFCRIVAGTIPARLAHEDDHTLAFHDIDPRAPVHVLIIPRVHIAAVDRIGNDDITTLGRLFVVARNLARELGVADSGYRLITNTGPDSGQEVFHLHVHVIGGRKLGPLA